MKRGFASQEEEQEEAGELPMTATYAEHRYAKDAITGAWISAKLAPNNERAYVCDCDTQHRLKLVRPSGEDGRRPFASYFAHINAANVCGGGEGPLHRLAKHQLREWFSAEGGTTTTIAFHTLFCSLCKRASEKCEFGAHLGQQLRLERRSENGRWRYDCLIYSSAPSSVGAVYAFEVLCTHRSTRGKIKDTRASGVGIAEFRAAGVGEAIAAACRSGQTELWLENLVLQRGVCSSCRRSMVEAAILAEYDATHAEWARLEAAMASEHEAIYERKRHVRETRALLAQAPTQQQQARVLLEACGAVMRCGALPLHGVRHVKDSAVFAFGDGNVLLVVEDDCREQGCERLHMEITLAWKRLSVPRDRVFAIAAATIARRTEQILLAALHGIAANDEVEFKDCLFPILMHAENEQQICATCGILGHRSVGCRFRRCMRCHRIGHSTHQCYARTVAKK